jgi:ABC-type bacteriocin/lantibiotic exporter with double-glycine peptidase domain
MFKKNQLHSILSMVDNSTIFSLVIISTMTSILFLVIPVAAQTLVNFIAFGHVLQPVFILSIMVFILIASAGALSLWHNILIEVIQQKLMVHVGFVLTRRFSMLSQSVLLSDDRQKEVNKFFDIVVIMKTLAGLLLYGVNISLQVFFGLVLLLIYHPYFIVFDLIVVVSIFLIIYFPYRVAKKTAEDECRQKHAIAEWFDEIFLSRYLFKFGRYSDFLLKETDNRLVAYLKVRNRHFRQLIKHQVGFYILAAGASSLLLGMGGYLVIANQLSLGQLVASEIIMGAIVYALKQSISILDDYYDLSASLCKFDDLLELPIEESHPIPDEIVSLIDGLQDIQLTWEKSPSAVFAKPGHPLLIYSVERAPIQTIVTNLVGLTHDSSEKIKLNEFHCTQQLLVALRTRAILLQEPQWFSGTIYDNLVLNTSGVSMDFVLENVNKLGLTNKLMSFPDGLLTLITSWQESFSESESVLLMVLRALINSPSLIIIDRTLDSISLELCNKVLSILADLKNTTIVITSQRSDFPNISNKWVLS